MKLQIIASIFLFFIVLIPSVAQDSLPIIEPEMILASSIDPENVQQLPLVQINDELRTLYYFDPYSLSWSHHNYPKGLSEIKDVAGHIRQQSDGTYLINTGGFYGFSQQLAEKAWIFDPETGYYSRPESICSGWIRSLQSEEWIIIESDEGYRLCNTHNGNTSPIIPSQIDDGYCPDQWRKPIVLSPLKTHILFFCGGLKFEAFSYNISQQIFQMLGTSPNDLNENIEIVKWVDDSQVIIHGYPSWNPPANVYYIVDIDKPEGLEFITYSLYASPQYFEDPPRIEWFPCEYGGCSPDSNSVLHEFDFNTQQLTIFSSVSGVNGVSLTIPDGSNDRLYRSLNELDYATMTAKSADLLRFNYSTKQVNTIYSGEIEWIESISPSGEYAALQIGSDGEVASSLILAHNQVGYLPSGQSRIHVINLTTGEILFEVTGQEFSNDLYFVYPPMKFDWIDDNTFLISGAEQYDYGTVIVRLDPQTTLIDEFDGYYHLSPSHDNILFQNGSLIEIYDIETKTKTQITYGSITNILTVGWFTDNSIIMTMSEDHKTIARWVITDW